MRKYIAGILFILSFIPARSQNPQVIPPSPVSQEFAKYVTQEVSLYNGIPEISIPLYTIELKGLAIPISISYHASGIRFAQDDGDVGVGWVINPGYRISRSIYGRADERADMPPDMLDVLRNYEWEANFGSTEAKVERDQFLAKFVPGGDFIYGDLDGEFDQFVFSLPNASGGFIITDRVNGTVTTTEESNLLIDYKVGQSLCSSLNGIKGFQIIDDVGNKYAFGEYNPQTQCFLETASSYYGGNVATAWGLSEIITPTGDEVKFKYIRREAGEFTDHIRSFTVRETNPDNCDIQTITSENIFTGHGYYTFFSEEIITPHERILFQYNTASPYPNKLNNIQIESSNGDILKTIEFFYSQDSHHTFLDHVTIYDSNHNDIETYRFDYYSKNTTATFTFDHYGYYLETYYPYQYYHQEFLDDPVLVSEPSTGQSCNNQTLNSYMEGLATSREPPNPFFVPDYFSLKRITYPTGGYTEYEYEHGRYTDVGGGPIKNGGIRIKTIKSSDLIKEESIVRKYTYGNDENGYGQAEAWVPNTESLFLKEIIEMNFLYPLSGVARVITYSTTMQGDIGTAFSQSGFVKYPCVTEYYSSSTPSGNGKTAYYFSIGHLLEIRTLSTRNIVPREVYNGSPFYVYRYRPWDKPRLERKVSYSLTEGLYIPLQEEVFEYEQTSNVYTGLKVEQSATNGGSNINNESYEIVWPGYSLDRYFNYAEYEIVTGKNVLKRKTEYQYLNGNTIFSEHSYDYSNFLVSKETIKRSTGDNLINYTAYPLDYASGATFIDDMKSNRLISYPVEKVSYLDNGTSQTILAGSINQYKTGGKGLLDTQWSLENTAPVSLGSFKFSNRALGILPPSGSQTSFLQDGRYARKITYDDYDNKGNILQHHKENDVDVSYVWSYNRMYPIAKIENADYSTLEAVLGGSAAVENFSTRSNPTDAEVKTFLAPLYTDTRLVKAMVSIYTYQPLTGMTSSTDSNGLITYFEYDDFGRLKIIKDQDNNVVKTYSYHYRE